MAKGNEGAKLNKYPEQRQKVIEWIFQEPSITDYEITKRLKEEEKFDIARPSITSWRRNHLPSLLEEYTKNQGTFEKTNITAKIEMKMNNLQTINTFIDEFQARRKELQKILPKYEYKKVKDDKTGIEEKIMYVGVGAIDTEDRYNTNTRIIVDLMHERDKIIGAFNAFDVAMETSQAVLKMFSEHFKDWLNKDAPEYKVFLKALKEYENRLKDRYNTDKRLSR